MEEFLAKIMEALSSVEGASVTIALVLEFVFRMIPSQKPLSIIYMVAAALKGVGEILVKAGHVLDKVLPQKLK